jgi:hypothetical protein
MNTKRKEVAEATKQALGTVEELNARIEAAASKDALPEDLIDLESNAHLFVELAAIGQSNKVLWEDLQHKDGKEKLFDLGYTMAAIIRTLNIFSSELGMEALESELGLVKSEHGYELPIKLHWAPSEDRRYYIFNGKKVRRAPGKATEAGRERHNEAQAKKLAKEAGNKSFHDSDEEYVAMMSSAVVPQSRS